MRYGGFEWALRLAALRIRVNPQLVTGQFGEFIYHGLINSDRFAPLAERLANQGIQMVLILVIDTTHLFTSGLAHGTLQQ